MTYAVEKIENGFVVRDVGNKRAVFVSSRWEIARQIERFMHDQVERDLAAEKAAEEAAEHAAQTAAAADWPDALIITADFPGRVTAPAASGAPMQSSED